jgi:hypothetical protein
VPTAHDAGAAEAMGSFGSTTMATLPVAPLRVDIAAAPAARPVCFRNPRRFIFLLLCQIS